MGKWVKARHKRVYRFFSPFFRWFLHKKFAFSCQSYNLDDGPYLILSNHQTKHDQFLISLLFNEMPYTVCRDDILRAGLSGKILRYMCAPIPKSKTAKDVSTVRICRQVIREGGNVALFPEGNLTFDGRLGTIDVSTAKLVKLLNVPTLLLSIEGGYGVLPRWHNKGRMGHFSIQVTRKLSREQIEEMSPQKLLDVIKKGLEHDELGTSNCYKSNKRAENLELLLYVCPNCGFSTFTSSFNDVSCDKCKTVWRYTEELSFLPSTPFANTAEWQKYQCDFVKAQGWEKYADKPLYCDRIKSLKTLSNNKKKKVLRNAQLILWYNKIQFVKGKKCTEMPFDQMSGFAVLGKNKMEIKFNDIDYLISPAKKVNAVKYMHLYTNSKCLQGDMSDTLGF